MALFKTTPSLLLRSFLTSFFIHVDTPKTFKLLQLLHSLLLSSFLLLLSLLPTSLSFFQPNLQTHKTHGYSCNTKRETKLVSSSATANSSGIARALSHLLSIANDIPASSRKYEVVRSLAETLIEENHRENVAALSEVNRHVLAAAFERTLCQLESAVKTAPSVDAGTEGGAESGYKPVQHRLNQVLRAVRSRVGRAKVRVDSQLSAEKLAAELLWLAQKLAACGFGEEAVRRWAAASNLGGLALSVEPRLQGSLVKVSVFLLKESKKLGEEEIEESKIEEERETMKKMLLSWLPLLCGASLGTDAPILSSREKVEMEKELREMVEMLEEEEEQEQVLSLWLHHFTHSPSSDWPNLHASYARWCTISRKHFLRQQNSI